MARPREYGKGELSAPQQTKELRVLISCTGYVQKLGRKGEARGPIDHI